MTERDGCEGCKYFNDDEVTRNSPCYECEGAHKSKTLSDNYTPMTNADKIRNMSDEELLDFIYDVSTNCTEVTIYHGKCADCLVGEKFCKNGYRKWLQKEAKK